MPNEAESLLDAVNAAIPSVEETDETEVLPDGEETPEGEETEGAETPEGEEAEGEEGEEGDEADAEEGDEEAEETDEEKAAAAAKKPAKEPDPINDPLPKGTLQKTAERFQHVVSQLKEQTAAREAAETQRDELINEITSAGMDGNTFGHMLEYARGVNSGTYEGLRKSYGILQAELKAIAATLGEPLPGENPLKGHDDLVAEVNEKKITPERAMEIAATRNRAAAQAKLGQQQQNSQQTAAQAQQAVAQGKAQLTALGKELAAKDGPAEYRRKAGLVVGMLKETLPNLPPKLWVKAFRAAYDQVPKAAAAPKAAAKPGQKHQPLRGNKVPSGQSSKEPKNMREAINAAFE